MYAIRSYYGSSLLSASARAVHPGCAQKAAGITNASIASRLSHLLLKCRLAINTPHRILIV